MGVTGGVLYVAEGCQKFPEFPEISFVEICSAYSPHVRGIYSVDDLIIKLRDPVARKALITFFLSLSNAIQTRRNCILYK